MAELNSRNLTTVSTDEQALTTMDMTGRSNNEGLPIANYNANATLSGNVAMASTPSDLDASSSYLTMQNELMEGNTKSTLEALGSLKVQSAAKAQDALVSVLTNPEIAQNTKDELATGFSQMTLSEEPNELANIVSFSALEKPSYGEGQEAESIRLNTAEIMNEVNTAKAQHHAMINTYNFAIDDITLKTGLDVVGLIAPFEEQISLSQITKDITGSEDTDISNMSTWDKFKLWTKTGALLGEAKVQIREQLKSMPPEQRLHATRLIADSINDSATISLNGENELRRMISANELLETGGYDNFDRWVDNIFGMLEIVGVGSIARTAKQTAKAKKLLETQRESNVVIEAMYKEAGLAADVKGGSYANNVKDTNPQDARAMHANAIADNTGEIANAAYGVDKNSVSIADNMPNIGMSDNATKAKLRNIDFSEEIMDTSIRSDILKEMQKTGNIDKYQKEIDSAISNVHQDFNNASGILPHKSQTSIGLGKVAVKSDRFDDTTDVLITATYTPEKAFANVDDLENTVRASLSKYDLGDNIVVSRKLSDGTYKESTIKELRAIEEVANASGGKLKPINDYQIQVKYEYSPNFRDVTEWHNADVKRSMMFAGKRTTETFFDPASKFEPQIVQGVGATDKRIAKIAGDLYAPVQNVLKGANFNSTDIKMISEYLESAYVEKKALDVSELRNKGFSDKQVEYVKAHRQAFNEIYYLRNDALTKQLKQDGWKKFTDDATETRLLAREKNVDDLAELSYYNQATDEIVDLTKSQIDEMLASGARFAETATPVLKGDVSAEFIVMSKGNFLKEVKPSDAILNYSHGYYDTKYTGAWFVDEITTLANGKQIKKAVGNYDDLPATKDALTRFTNTKGSESVKYIFRQAKERESAQDTVGMLQAQGKSRWSQTRGKLLDNGTGIERDQTKHLKNPIETLMNSIESTAREVGGTEMMNTMKTRFFETNKDWMPPVDTNDLSKGRRMPNDLSEIKNWGDVNEDPAAINAAKEMFNYIDVVENGFTNLLGDLTKNALDGLATMLGNKGFGAAERGIRKAGDASVQGAVKSVAFETMIAMNPLRQFAMNAHQATQLTVVEPAYVLSQGLLRDLSAVSALRTWGGVEDAGAIKKAAKLAGKTESEMKDMYNAAIKSGVFEGASNNTIAKASMSNLVHNTNPLLRGYGKVSESVRRVGFDIGENVNQLSSFLTHYHRAVKAGENPRELRTIEKITGQAENFTYNMNTRASDVGYTHGSAGVFFQFQNVIHKGMLSMTANRGLTRAERAKLLAFNTTMYSLPAPTMLAVFGDYLPEDNPELRDALVMGLEFYSLNKLVQLATGDKDTRLDFGNFSPVSLGNFELLHSFIADKTFTEALAGTPAGGLFLGNNPRLTNAGKSVVKLFQSVGDDQFETVDTLKHSAIEFGKMFSGLSNAMRAKAIHETGRIENAIGNRVLSENGSAATALARLWGIQSMEEIEQYYVGSTVQELKTQQKEMATDVYKEMVNYQKNIGNTFDSSEAFVNGINYAYTVFGQEVGDQVLNMYNKDLKNRNLDAYDAIISVSGLELGNPDKLRALAANIQSDEKREGLLKMFDTIDKYKEEEWD